MIFQVGLKNIIFIYFCDNFKIGIGDTGSVSNKNPWKSGMLVNKLRFAIYYFKKIIKIFLILSSFQLLTRFSKIAQQVFFICIPS